jgi:hypothetical protein
MSNSCSFLSHFPIYIFEYFSFKIVILRIYLSSFLKFFLWDTVLASGINGSIILYSKPISIDGALGFYDSAVCLIIDQRKFFRISYLCVKSIIYGINGMP